MFSVAAVNFTGEKGLAFARPGPDLGIPVLVEVPYLVCVLLCICPRPVREASVAGVACRAAV